VAFLYADGDTTMWKLSFRESDVLEWTGQNCTLEVCSALGCEIVTSEWYELIGSSM
jgi:hypothetical protein